MTGSLVIDRRFRGPLAFGNGGVSAGLLASMTDGLPSVQLRKPPPLDRPLQIHPRDDVIDVVDDGQVVLRATDGHRPVTPPLDDDVLERTFARGSNPIPAWHAAPECFVCGPREDGLRLCPMHLPDTDVWSTVWNPDALLSRGGATVDRHVVWGALDCPAGFAVCEAGVAEPTFFPALTRQTVQIEAPAPVGRPVAVFGWAISEDQQRVNGGSALIDEHGTVLASAYAEHARLSMNFANT